MRGSTFHDSATPPLTRARPPASSTRVALCGARSPSSSTHLTLRGSIIPDSANPPRFRTRLPASSTHLPFRGSAPTLPNSVPSRRTPSRSTPSVQTRPTSPYTTIIIGLYFHAHRRLHPQQSP